jgi:hypothetical protein
MPLLWNKPFTFEKGKFIIGTYSIFHVYLHKINKNYLNLIQITNYNKGKEINNNNNSNKKTFFKIRLSEILT